MGNVAYIIPESIGHSKIEYILNNKNKVPYCTDKNSYDLLLNGLNRPQTLLRMNDLFNIFDDKYSFICKIDDINKHLKRYISGDNFFIKPTSDTGSGRGVRKFDFKEGKFVDKDGEEFTADYVKKYYKTFVIQETIRQNSFMNSFCSTSINTIRACVYRSIKSGEAFLTAAALRIGQEGSDVDNIHSGGLMAKIDINSGEIGNFLLDDDANKYDKINNIDFANSDFQIPNWSLIKDFIYRVSDRFVDFHLIALDICIDSNDKPMVIEVNIEKFSFWIPMYFGFDVFNGETSDVIKFVKSRL